MMRQVLMFPGQGSQKIGMGKDLFSLFPKEIETANQILGYSVEDLCLNEENKTKLNQTHYTQPLLFLVNHLHFLHFLKGSENSFAELLGHSLGEYNALVAADSIEFAEGLKIVKERGKLMSRLLDGGMLAVLGMSDEEIEKAIEGFSHIEIANFNANGQTVLSGDLKELKELAEDLKKNHRKKAIPLPVSGAFHSSFMKEIAQDFNSFLSEKKIKNPQKTVIANITAEPYPSKPIGESSEIIRTYLVKQLYSPVRWKQSIKYLREKNQEDLTFIEIGPGSVLKNLLKRI